MSGDQFCNSTRTQQEPCVEILLWQQKESADGFECHLNKEIVELEIEPLKEMFVMETLKNPEGRK